ncbi:MAG TPA: glycoside hydrolase family 36 protein, partial [Tepidisphaeraceae bacterium]|nr:glycoside hydrolase family 36 protein [Tepidisphaeraceae bacterium]
MRKSVIVAMAMMILPSLAWADDGGVVTIENSAVRVSVNSVDDHFTIESVSAGNKVVSSGTFAMPGTVEKLGNAITITAADGAEAQISVEPASPFVLFRRTLLNTQKEPVILNKVPVVTFDADWTDAASLMTMGTGGLSKPDANPGSYVWLAVAEPRSRNGLVAAWLTEDRASGVLFPTVVNGKVVITARADYGRLRLLPGKSTETETLAIGYFDDARVGLEDWADAVAAHYQIKLPPQPTGYCTWYAEKHGGACNQNDLKTLADFAQKNLEPFGFNFVQIDDGWQLGVKKNGPRKNFTSFNPNGPYPDGMKATADFLKAHGLTPGIWFMPFAGNYTDPWFADKQDLFVKTASGKPYDVKWGGTSLDMTNPKARDYLRSIVDTLANKWGFEYFKMDGLFTGTACQLNYVNSGYKEDHFGDAVFFDPNVTNVQAFRIGMKLIRDTAGPNVFLLGCNLAQNMRMFGASFGMFDAMRVGPDNNGHSWSGWMRSPISGSRLYFLNGRIWFNDP